jgi:uncharacterized protein DUF4375
MMPIKAMKRSNVFVVIKSEQERAEFSAAGVELSSGPKTPDGELVSFHLEENDPRWKKVKPLLQKHMVAHAAEVELQERRLGEASRVRFKETGQSGLQRLDRYSGEAVEELLALEGKCRTDSLILAFEQAIGQKVAREGRHRLTDEENIVLAVEAFEREVNNGGYDQFFTNSSREYASTVVDSFQRIGCEKTAKITQRAIDALGVADVTPKAIEAVMGVHDEQRQEKLSRCDDAYYKAAEPIADQLFAFIKANKTNIRC